jgi:hypothetical protein
MSYHSDDITKSTEDTPSDIKPDITKSIEDTSSDIKPDMSTYKNFISILDKQRLFPTVYNNQKRRIITLTLSPIFGGKTFRLY